MPDCPSGYLSADLSGFAGWKGGCGAIGGLRGTVYAAHDEARNGAVALKAFLDRRR